MSLPSTFTCSESFYFNIKSHVSHTKTSRYCILFLLSMLPSFPWWHSSYFPIFLFPLFMRFMFVLFHMLLLNNFYHLLECWIRGFDENWWQLVGSLSLLYLWKGGTDNIGYFRLFWDDKQENKFHFLNQIYQSMIPSERLYIFCSSI